MQELYSQLKQFGQVKLREPLAKHTTCRIGGEADVFLIVESTDNLVSALCYLDDTGTSYMMLGGGSNTMPSDDGFRGVVIHSNDQSMVFQDTQVTIGAGAITARVAHETVKHQLAGFEWGVGVPGTIGGAVFGNAGAMGKDMNDDLHSVEAYIDGEVVTLSKKECEFGYRTSRFKKKGGVVLRATLSLQPAVSADGMKIALSTLQYRHATQPKGHSSGCVFTNADLTDANKKALLTHFDSTDEKIQKFLQVGKISAGWLIEQAGLKGLQIGQAQVSDVHGNFILNRGGASSQDVLTLIEQVKQTVQEKFGIVLEEEIRVV